MGAKVQQMKGKSMSVKHEAAQQLALATPAGGVASLTLLGIDLPTMIQVGTLLLILLQVGFLVHKWVRMARAKEDACSSDND